MHKFLTIVVASALNLLLRFICGSNRLTVTRRDVFDQYAEQGNNMFVFWHSRLFYLVYYYVKRAPLRKVSILISLSKDGDYGAALVRKFKQDAIRGSTSRGGQKAVRGLAAKVLEGNNVALTPDGPRGPAFKVNERVIKLAQITGARIVPVSYDATRKRVFKSWDRFIALKPYGRVHMAFADPIEVPRNITPEERRQYRERLEQTLLKLDRICTQALEGKAASQEETATDAYTPEPQSVASTQRASVP